MTLSAAVVASWARYAEGTDEQGEPIKVVDRLADTLQQIAARQRGDPLAFVENRELFGELAAEPAFTGPYLNALNSLHSRGAAFDRSRPSPGVHLPSSRIADQRNGANSLRTTPIRSGRGEDCQQRNGGHR